MRLAELVSRLRRQPSEDDVAIPWVVIGLGNPGPEYAATRHNVGYLVVEELAGRLGGSWKAHRGGRALVVEGRLRTPTGDDPGGERLVLGRARSYMNESGGAVAGLLAYYKVGPDRLVAVHDELDLPYGDLRVKLGGGDNGHNGLKSVRRSLSSGDFYRVRFGIGRPPGRQDPADWVLRPFSSSERRDLPHHVDRAADAVESLLVAGLEPTQSRFNS